MQLSVMQVNAQEISHYGVVVPNSEGKGIIVGLVEKPLFHEASSNLASIGRYMLTPDIFAALRDQKAGSGGEIQLADALNQKAKYNLVEIVELKGDRFDCGTVLGYLNAIIHVAKQRLVSI